jgi:hypothetical protein
MKSVCRVFEGLQQRPRQAGLPALEYCIYGGAPRISSNDSQGENQRSSIHWLYLTMNLLKALFWVNSDFVHGENPVSLIGQRQRVCIASFLKVLFLDNLFFSPSDG